MLLYCSFLSGGRISHSSTKAAHFSPPSLQVILIYILWPAALYMKLRTEEHSPRTKPNHHADWDTTIQDFSRESRSIQHSRLCTTNAVECFSDYSDASVVSKVERMKLSFAVSFSLLHTLAGFESVCKILRLVFRADFKISPPFRQVSDLKRCRDILDQNLKAHKLSGPIANLAGNSHDGSTISIVAQTR